VLYKFITLLYFTSFTDGYHNDSMMMFAAHDNMQDLLSTAQQQPKPNPMVAQAHK